MIFKNDVHNGVYEIADITGDMIMGMKDRTYKEIYERPPEPTDVDDGKGKGKKPGGDDEEPQKLFKPSSNDYNPDHQVYTTEQLRNKIQKEELYDMLQKKKNYNTEEGDYLQKKIDQVDPGFEKRIAKQKEEEAEKDKKLKENNEEMASFNNIQPRGRNESNNIVNETNSLSKSKNSKLSKSGSGNGSDNPKKTEESKVKNTLESKKSSQSKKSKKSKKSSKKESEDEDEEEEEEEDDE